MVHFDSFFCMIQRVNGGNLTLKLMFSLCSSTYDRVSYYPGQYLNIIVGPNGTGKSTLVAAIVLGMGGHPKVLSRSQNVRFLVLCQS